MRTAPTQSSRILTANVNEWERQNRAEPPGNVPRFLRTPKGQLLCIFGVLLLITAPTQGGLSLVARLLVAALAACGIDLLLTFWKMRRWVIPTSALLSAWIVAFIVGPQEPLFVLASVAAFATVTKHVFATDREHIFNPAALALLASAVVLGTGESWWGALGDLPEIWALVLIATGVFVVDRLNKFPLVLTFLGAYFGACTLVAWVSATAMAEMFRAPFLQSALFVAFFMVTDPPTSPSRIGDQVWYGLLAACVAIGSQLLGAGQVYLLVGVLAANVWLALRRWYTRRVVRPDASQTHQPRTSSDSAIP